MKYLLLSLVSAFILVFTLQSCNEEIDLVGEFKETAVVYGLLDQSDSVHYIKITRAFIGPGNSLDIAQNPDSSYFNSVSATITEIGGSGRTWNLVEETITNKDENGVFYAPEQRVYALYSKSIDNSDSPTFEPLNPNATYAINININNGLFVITGQTRLVSGITTSTDSGSFQFRFAENVDEYENPTIQVNVGNSYVVNTSIDVHMDEFIGAGAATPSTMTWTIGERDVNSGSTAGFSATGKIFYEQIANFCSQRDLVNPGIDKRNFTGLTIRVIGGGEELYNYMLVNQPSSSLAQNKPTYTNLSATNDHPVIGVFSSRFTREVYHVFSTPLSQFTRCLDRKSTEALCIGPITGPYLFCSQHDQDLFPTPETFACN